jgi:hypothetical protein
VDGLHLVPVVTGVSDFEAKLLAARLGADGILWQTRGIVDSIYPFGGIDVLVPVDQLDDARQGLALVVEPAPLDPALAPVGNPGAGALALGTVEHGAGRPPLWVGLAAAGAVVAMAAVRVLALG